MKKCLLVLIFFFISIAICYGSGKGELGRKDFKTLTDNIIKWKGKDITSYSIKVLYASGNLPDTLFEIKVEKKKVVKCIQNEVELTDLSKVKQYTIDEMHDSTKKLVRSNKKNAPMLYVVKYDDTYGYITSLVRIYNPKAKAALGTEDFNYRIKVFDFVPEEPVAK